MIVVQIMLGRTRSLMRKVAVLIAASQLVLGSAPLFESGARDASAHIEANGVALHHVHDEANCIAFTASRLLSGAEPLQPAAINAVARIASPRSEVVETWFSARTSDNHSRAPPVVLS